MMTRRQLLAATAGILGGVGPAMAQATMKVVATFSILADLVGNVGGERVGIATLVGANGDAHVYAPSPSDARTLAAARIVFVNGLGFEGWMERLVEASATRAAIVVTSQGVPPRRRDGGRDRSEIDPHAWQSVANAAIYVANIRDALVRADPAGRSAYEADARSYLGQLDALEAEVRSQLGRIPPDRRRIITSHDAFGYFAAAYGITMIAPRGVSTESEPSARDVAAIITQIRRQQIPAVFLENVSDPRLLERISQETGAKIGGTLYSDALTGATGEAPTYIAMMRHNVRQLAAALAAG